VTSPSHMLSATHETQRDPGMIDRSQGPGWWSNSDSRRHPAEFGDGLALHGAGQRLAGVDG
jgi:hypothetical protein